MTRPFPMQIRSEWMFNRRAAMHFFVMPSQNDTICVAQDFAQAVMGAQKTAPEQFCLFNLGMVGAKGSGKTTFTNRMIDAAGACKIYWEWGEKRERILRSEGLGLIVRADTHRQFSDYRVMMGMRWKSARMLRHAFTRQGMDIVEHPDGCNRRDYHAVIHIDRTGSYAGIEARNLVIATVPELAEQPSFKTFLEKTQRFSSAPQ